MLNLIIILVIIIFPAWGPPPARFRRIERSHDFRLMTRALPKVRQLKCGESGMSHFDE